MLIQEFLL